MAIMAILAGLAAPSFNQWIANSKIRNAADAINIGIQLARAEAIRRNATIDFTFVGGATSAGWQFGCTPPGTATCVDPIIDQRSTTEGNSATISAVVAGGLPRTFTFNSMGRMTAPVPAGAAGCAQNLCINITDTTGTGDRPLRVTVSPSGTTFLCDPSVTVATDSRACPTI